MPETLPHIFLSFANDHNGAFLHALEPERRALRKELAVFQRNGWGYYHSSSSSAAEHLIEDLQLYPRQISIFHFSGHADGESLQLESQKKEQQNLHKNNLLSILKEEVQNNLQLVFLNACETKGMLEGLQELNVHAVILTNTVIPDRQAKEFSLAFYRSLLNGSTLETAFSQAKTLIDSSSSDSRVFRAIDLSFLKNKKEGEEILWGLHVLDDAVLNWRLLDGKASNPKSETKALNKIPGSHQDFVGRDKELRELRHLLQKEKPVLLLNGIGGIGKTTLARQYLHDNYFHFDKIVWVSVLSDQLDEDKGFQTATDALGNDVALMDQLGVAFDKEQSAAERAVEILSRLRTQSGQNLLVIDNAGFSLEDIRKELPQPPNWQVLITSRKELPGLSVKRLDELPREEALELFYLHYPQGQDEAKDVETLLEYIGYHTLTLELFAKTCQKSPSTNPAQILKLLQGKKLEKLSRKVFAEHSNREVEVYSYLLAAFELHELTEAELSVLIQWAILPPQEIEWDLLLKLYSVGGEKIQVFENSLIGLQEKGWIEKGKAGGGYRIHQLIQEVIRYRHEPNEENCGTLIRGVKNLLFVNKTQDNPIDKFPYVPFGESVLLSVLKEGKEKVTLQNNLALRYYDLGEYENAKDLLEVVLSSVLKHVGEEHPNTATIRSDLAMVYYALGDYKRAEGLLELSLTSNLKSLGENHPITARSRSNLALVLKAQGKNEQAADLLDSAISSTKKNLGNDHPYTAMSMSNQALVFMELGKYEQAAELFKIVLNSTLRSFGEDHPTVNLSRMNLGVIYQYLGENEQAADLLELTLRSALKSFGEDHPSTALNRSNLAAAYKNLGKYKKAADLLELALTSNRKRLGEDHPSTVKNRSNLAMVYQDLGKYEKAIGLLEIALSSSLKNFREDHSSTAIIKSNIANVYIRMGKNKEALMLFKQAYDTLLKLLGPEHPNTKIAKEWLDNIDHGTSVHWLIRMFKRIFE